MNEGTRLLLQSLEQAAWFTAVGQPINDDTVARVFSWREAFEQCEAEWRAWSGRFQANNELCEHFAAKYPEEFDKSWNEIADAVSAITDPLIMTKTDKVVKSEKVGPHFIVAVKYDVFGAVIESEFPEAFVQKFFADVVKWYLRGHFPCACESQKRSGMGRFILF